MTYDRTKEPTVNENTRSGGSARNWYTLQAGDIGNKELPKYARAFDVRLGSGSPSAVTLLVVPIGETDDAATRTIVVSASETFARAIRRIVSINGANTIPGGVVIDLITE